MGHAYEKILADAIACTKRLLGTNTRFVTGLDEHGQKVQGAEKEGIEPQQRCDRIADEFKDVLERLEISNDDYIRITEQRHKQVVADLLQQLFDSGDIYQMNTKDFIQHEPSNFTGERQSRRRIA